MDQDDVYDAARGWWVVGPKREQCQYAIVVAQGVVRGVFHIHAWRPRGRGDHNWQDDPPDKPSRHRPDAAATDGDTTKAPPTSNAARAGKGAEPYERP